MNGVLAGGTTMSTHTTMKQRRLFRYVVMETSVHHPTIVVEQQHMHGIKLTSLEKQTMSEGVTE